MNEVDLSRALKAIRFLSADGVQVANSGHPGLPMGAAGIAYAIFMRHLKHNPKDAKWVNRDRFVLSGGHGSMLLYTMLYLTGYPMTKEDLAKFRQLGSITPGHPEYGKTIGVETTTGPLGQGFTNAVGMAIAESHLAAEFNRPDLKIVDHYTYVICTDGDLMEGVTSEAASIAGHLKLGKLICIYDSNKISIEGSTDLTFTENVGQRFEAYGWDVNTVEDGNDVEKIDLAISAARRTAQPSLIICRTTIGFGLPTKAGTASIHGSPVGWDELSKAKENAGWPTEPLFYVPDDILNHFRLSVKKGEDNENSWQGLFDAYEKAYPQLASEFERRMSGSLPERWEKALPNFPTDPKGMGSRVASGKVINALAPVIPELIGGSADLAPSTNTWMNDFAAFSAEHPEGRNFHFGIREHAMAGIVNGLFAHGGLIPFSATFAVFSDYLRPALRMAALSHFGSIFILTHDSIGVGEDGPTHQPIEQVMSLRLIPELTVLRPADANETAQAWKYVIQHRDRPIALILSRQNLPTIDRSKYSSAEGLQKGAYVLYDTDGNAPDLILMATGSEVSLALAAIPQLEARGVKLRVVSFPSWEIFNSQPAEYQESIFPKAVTQRISIEAGVTTGWQKWVGEAGITIGIDHFGTSAPGDVVMHEFGFTVENLIGQASKLL